MTYISSVIQSLTMTISTNDFAQKIFYFGIFNITPKSIRLVSLHHSILCLAICVAFLLPESYRSSTYQFVNCLFLRLQLFQFIFNVLFIYFFIFLSFISFSYCMSIDNSSQKKSFLQLCVIPCSIKFCMMTYCVCRLLYCAAASDVSIISCMYFHYLYKLGFLLLCLFL